MAEYYQKLLQSETDLLNSHIAKYNSILDSNGEHLSESISGQIHIAIGQSNLFINERFKQFSGLIDDYLEKRGEKEIKVEDLAGFWDMIYYQVEDLKQKYDELAKLEANNWMPIEEKLAKPVLVNDNKVNIIKNRNQRKKDDATDGRPVATKKPVRSNFREFLKNKKKEMASKGDDATTVSNGSQNGDEPSQPDESSASPAEESGESRKLRILTETMSHSLTVIDDTNKEN